MKRILLIVFLTAAVSCAKTPPNLSPAAVVAFHGTQAVKALDLLRDTVIAAREQGLMSEDSTRKVVQWHEHVLKVINASPSGWKPTAEVLLDELLAALPDADKETLRPYVTLVRTVVREVGR